MKFINNLKHVGVLCIALFGLHVMSAQEVINEEVVNEEVVKPEVKKIDSTASQSARKIDGVGAVVGDFIVLESDVSKERLQLEAGGYDSKTITDCELFGKLLENKLYAHHAIQDSIVVSDAEIRKNVDYQVEQFLAQSGKSMKELLEFYKKDDEKSFRDEMFEINKNNQLATKMQANIVEKVEITPEEVRQFFDKIPKDERPTFGTELKVAQIVVEPKITEEEKQRVINRLKEFKADIIENGASFRSKAVLYSEDTQSGRQGGKLGSLNRDKPRMVKEFREVAFTLQEGEISEPFETEFGYHIISCDKIRGKEIDVSHILLFPKVSTEAVNEAKDRLEKIRTRIVNGEISFADAAKEASDEKETRGDGGQLINPTTQDYNFELTRMEPEMYAQIQNLKDNEVSLVLKEEDRASKLKFKILMVTDRINEHEADYARDYLKIKERALDAKKIDAIAKWQEDKILDTFVKISGDYRNCEFSSNWLKK